MEAAMKKPLGITTLIGALCVHWSGCAAPCPVIPERDCDRTKSDHNCRDVCANEEQVDEGEEAEEIRAPNASVDDEQADGQASDEGTGANKG